MVAKKGNDGSSKDVLQKAEESTTLKEGQKETIKAKDENNSESFVNNDAQPTGTEAKPNLKAATQASKTTSKKTNTLEPGNKQAEAKETKQSKVDVPKKRIRTYLKPRVPSFRKLASKKKPVKGPNVPACRPMMQKRKPLLPKFHSKTKSVKTQTRAISPRRRAQKARFRRKPPVPRFAISKRRSVSLKNQDKQDITGYQRRTKRKPPLPDFSGRRKQKRPKIGQVEQVQPKSIVQKKTNSKTVSTNTPNSQMKTAQSNKDTAILNSSDASTKSVHPSSSKTNNKANIRFPSKPCSKSVSSSTGKSVKLKERVKLPKTRLERERKAKTETKNAHSQTSGERLLSKSTSSMNKESVVKSLSFKKTNKSLKANDKGAVDKADQMGRKHTGQQQPPAGGGSMQKVPETEQPSTVM